jgi:Pyruvate/2-oxoacid:ferredoxin oxidoreductase delta subunit
MYYAAQLKDAALCNGCRICILACPEANAIAAVKGEGKKIKVEINIAMCKGCSVCVELCPKQALEMASK